MPVVYNLGQHGAPSSTVLPSSSSPLRSASPSPSLSLTSWLELSSPWLCGALLVLAALLVRHRRKVMSRDVSMSPAGATKPTKSPTPSHRGSDDRLWPEKDAFSTSTSSLSRSPTVATVIKHGPHSSGTTSATITTTSAPPWNVFPYPGPPSPTLSPMSEEEDYYVNQERPAMISDRDSLRLPALSEAAPASAATAPSTPPFSSPSSNNTSAITNVPRRRSYTKTSTVTITPKLPSPPRAHTFPITADASEFQFGTSSSAPGNSGASINNDPNAPPAQLVMGIELAEEVIIAAEGWRRHTRVYGGGVCRACEESEQQMRSMGVRPPVEMDA